MKTHKRKIVAPFAFSLLALSMVLSVAWACTGQPQVVALSLDRAPSESEVTVIGQRVPTQFVEIRWDSLHGPVIGKGEATIGDFAIATRIPKAAPGIYYMVVSALPLGYPKGTPPSITRVSFEVTASPAASRDASGPPGAERRHSADLWSAFSAAHDNASLNSAATADDDASSARALGIGLGVFAFGAGALIISGATAVLTRRRPGLRGTAGAE